MSSSNAGQGGAELRAEAEAILLGLPAVLDLKDYSDFHGISVLTDSQQLVRCLATGPAFYLQHHMDSLVNC